MSDLLNINKRLNTAIEYSGMSYGDIAEKTGLPKSAIHRYATGETPKIPVDRIMIIGKAIGVSPAWIMGWQHGKTEEPVPYGLSVISTMTKVPRLGNIACGDPIYAESNFDCYDDVPEGIVCDFTLKCEGDSMVNAQINDGDIVYIKKQPIVENGEIAAVWVDGATTLKRFYQQGNTVTLMPENPRYAPIVLAKDQLNTIRIFGKAVGFTRIFDK